jgi:hypothetical protein
VYLELSQSARVYMKGVSPINPQWLPRLAAPMCDRTGPLAEPAPRYDAELDEAICQRLPRGSGQLGSFGCPASLRSCVYDAHNLFVTLFELCRFCV